MHRSAEVPKPRKSHITSNIPDRSAVGRFGTPSIFFECENFLIISKPSCWHSVANSDEELERGDTVAGWLLSRFPDLEAVSGKPFEGGLLNRLDYETSGLLIAARTAPAHTDLRRLLLAGEISKTYLAVLEGCLRENRIVRKPIGSPNRGARKVRVFDRPTKARDRALPAETIFQVLVTSADSNRTLCSVTAHSARRHQIRAHAASLGHPLAGDQLYGGSAHMLAAPPFLLHARTLTFEYEGRHDFVLEAPPYFRDFFEGLDAGRMKSFLPSGS